ncbi:Antirestriction protein (ArdA) [compost metagenome]
MADVAYYAIEENGLLEGASETLARYFDYEAYGRDLEIEGTFLKVNYNTFVEIIG